MDEDVWNRKHVKYNSEQIMEKQQTKNRKKAKGKKRKPNIEYPANAEISRML